MKQSKKIVTPIRLIGLMMVLLLPIACSYQDKSELVDDEDASLGLTTGLAIRGGTCSAAAFTNGAEHVSGDYLTGLSVNCTTATGNKANYVNYLAGIGDYANYCVAKMSQLELSAVKIAAAPVTGNRYHCLISGKAKNIAKSLTRYP